jgi:hypothetical protein
MSWTLRGISYASSFRPAAGDRIAGRILLRIIYMKGEEFIMKTLRSVVCTCAAMLLLCSIVDAQDTLRYHLGAGVSVEPALFGQMVYTSTGGSGPYLTVGPLYSVSPYYIYLPVTLTRNVRIEPRFGIYSFSNESSNSLTPSQPTKDNLTLTHIGLSIEYLIPVTERFQIYAGPRAGLNFISETSSYYGYTVYPAYGNITTTQSETDFMISGIFGAEYFPLRELSVGGEIDFNYVSFGNPDYTQSSPSSATQGTTTRTQSLVSTGALLFVRWYFL